MRNEDIEYFESRFRVKPEKSIDKDGLSYYKDDYINFVFAGFQMGIIYKEREIEIISDELKDARKVIKYQ